MQLHFNNKSDLCKLHSGRFPHSLDRSILGIAALVIALTPWCGYSNANDRPNVILFFADDLGWNGVNSFGSDLHETPNVDGLVRDGMKFTDAYSACTVCSPSRAAIMTGKYPARLHLTDFIAGQDQPFEKLLIPEWTKKLRHQEVTLPEALSADGYKTAHIGKWHLNPKTSDADDYEPVDHGFDVQVMKPKSKGYFMTKPAGDFKPGDFTTDYFAAEAAKIVQQWKDDPFFLYFAFDVPHTPIQGKKELVQQYSKKTQPDAIHRNPVYAAMVHSMDQAIGTVLKALEQNGLAEDTVVIFTSDNGGLSHKFRKETGFTLNDPLRRGKGSGYEGGVRVPMVVRWPGVVSASTQNATPVIGPDLYPTILEIAGTEGNPGHNEDVDGMSLVPLLKGQSKAPGRDAIYWHYPHYHAGGFGLPTKGQDTAPRDGPYSAIRSGDWKLIEFLEDGRTELYNLSDDVAESVDLSLRDRGKAEELKTKLDKWRRNVGAQIPTPNPNHDPSKVR